MYQKRNKELEVIELYLNEYNKQMYLREIGRLAKIPLKTTQNILFKLEKEKILLSELHGKNKYFKLNTEKIETKFFILQAEINKTIKFAAKYPEFKTFLKEMKTNTPLIVFGSFATFSADKNSDLDIMIVSKIKEDLPFHLLPYKIQQIKITENDFYKMIEKKEPLMKEIQNKHIILNNHSFFTNTMWNAK